MSRIKPLQQDAIAQIQSTKQVTSLNDVLSALVENSLDAGSSKIKISIDYTRGSCTLEDNGCGILSDDFREDGGLARMYHSSHPVSSPLERYGRSGTSLASLAALALLTIHSRHQDEETSSSLILHRAQVITRHVSSGSSEDLHMHGTRVSVRNLFGNIPVRLVQRSLASESASQVEKQWLDLRYRVVALLLSCQKPCSLRIDDEGHSGRSLNIPAQATGSASALTKRSLQHLSGKHMAPDLRDSLPILYHSGFAPPESRPHWVPLSASTSNVSVKGVMCLYPVPNKQCQFISIGIHPCLSRNGHHELYEAVNTLFDRSDFGLLDEATEVVVDGNKNRGVAPAKKRPRKGIDRWPMFVLRITLGHDRPYHPELKDPSTAWLESAVNVLSAAVTQWLKVNHFRPQARRQKRKADAHATATKASSQITDAFIGSKRRETSSADKLASSELDDSLGSPYETWSQIKGGKAFRPWDTLGKDTERSQIPATAPSTTDPSSDEFDGISDSDLLAIAGVDYVENARLEHDDNVITWKDAKTGKVHTLDARTGVVLPEPQTTEGSSSSATLAQDQAQLLHKSHLSLPHRRNKAPAVGEQQWLPGFLRQWDNPVFKHRPEPPIPVASIEGPGVEIADSGHSRCNHAELSNHFLQAATTKSMKLSRNDLSKAQVMSQVDGKFILCRTHSDVSVGAFSLLLIDQHAASERVILEDLFAQLCAPIPVDEQRFRSSLGHVSSIAYVLLDRPLHYTISAAEHDLFHRVAAFFATWGILYDLTTPSSLTSQPKPSPVITVRTLPPGIAERCSVSPNLLIDILRSEVWSEHPSHSSSLPTTNDDDEATSHPWVRRISACSRGVIDMLNSRACRSAIMFNDVLSVAECEELLGKLARCAFPFMCAHGRVSMVPLMEIGGEGDVLGLVQDKNAPRGGLKSALKKWTKEG